jgi:hypothetical protein
MRVLSGLVCAGLIAAAALGQQPPAVEKTETKPVDSAKDTLEQAIAAALRNNPDVRVAEAEAQVAQAKLAQAKLKVAQQVAAARYAVERARSEVAAAAEAVEAARPDVEVARLKAANTEELHRQKVVSNLETQLARQVYAKVKAGMDAAARGVEAAKGRLAQAEAEYHTLLGAVPGQPATATTFLLSANELVIEGGGRLMRWDAELRPEMRSGTLHLRLAATPGSVADKLREALDRPVKLPAQENVPLDPLIAELMKAAGLDVRVKLPPREDPKLFQDVTRLTLAAGELPLGTWLQLITDEVSGRRALDTTGTVNRPARYDLYVREYGLLLADRQNVPPDAITVQEFWKQTRTEKAAKEKADAEKAKEPNK